jgi:hypothetical protein
VVLFSFARANERLPSPMITLALLGDVMLERGAMRRLELFPMTLQYARVRLGRGAEWVTTLDRMEKLSAEMGTVFGRREDRLVLEP